MTRKITLVGDTGGSEGDLARPSKAKAELGWNPTKTTFEQLVKIMVDADMAKGSIR